MYMNGRWTITADDEVGDPLQGAEEDEPSQRRRRRRSRSARFGMLNRFVDETMSRLTDAETKVWLAMFRSATGDVVTVSQAVLAKRSGVTERSVRRAIVSLVRRGLLAVVSRGGQGHPGRYRIAAVP